MGATLVVARGGSLFVVPERGAPREFPEAAPPDAGAPAPAGLDAAVRVLSAAGSIAACGPELARLLGERLPGRVRAAEAAEWHRALARAPVPLEERERLLARARAELERALRSPEEVLISLAREEERLERAVGREARAAEAFVEVVGTPLAEYGRQWSTARAQLADHHRRLLERLEAEARRTAPSLAQVVGPRVAARLVAAAGGLGALARFPAARLQLLGARRRPAADRTPRHGIVFLAEGADQVPADRRAAYTRSLAALAVIAARADALTHADLGPALRRRRDARIARLRRRSG